MTQEDFEKKLWEEAMLVVPRVVVREEPGVFGWRYNEVIMEPVTFEQMIQIKKQQGKI